MNGTYFSQVWKVIAILLMAVILPAKAVALADEKAQPRIVSQLGHPGWVSSLAFLPNGKQALSLGGGAGEGAIKLWDIGTGALLRTFTQPGGVSSFALSKDGKYIFSTGDHLILWSTETGGILRELGSWGTAVAFSPDGKRLASLDFSELTLWDFKTGQLLHHIKADLTMVSDVVAFSPDSRQVVTSGEKFIELWDSETGRLIQRLGPQAFPESIEFAPDGSTLLSRSGSDKTIKLWNLRTGQLLRSFPQEEFVTNALFSPDGRKILTAGPTPEVQDSVTGSHLLTFNRAGGLINSAAFSPDGRQVLFGLDEGKIELWDATTGKQTRMLEPPKTSSRAARHFIVSPDRRHILFASLQNGSAGSSDIPKLFDMTSGTFVGIGSAPSGYGVFSPDGKRLLLVTNGTAIDLWDIPSGILLHSFKNNTAPVS